MKDTIQFVQCSWRYAAFLAAGLCLAQAAHGQGWSWLERPCGGGELEKPLVAADGAGNLIVAAGLRDTITLGATTLVSPAVTRLLVAKYDAQRAVAWAVQSLGPGSVAVTATAVDAGGQVFVAGSFEDTVAFGPTQLIAQGPTDGFVAKLSAGGQWQWARRVGSAGRDMIRAMKADGTGSVYACGDVEGQVMVGTTVVGSPGSVTGVVARLSATGNWLWARQAANVFATSVTGLGSLALDPAGNVYVGGWYLIGAQVGATTMISPGDPFVASLTPAGSWRWVAEVRGYGFCSTINIDCLGATSAGDVYVAGSHLLGGELGAVLLPADDDARRQGYLAKIAAGGTWQWATNIGANAFPVSAAVDGAGALFLAGSFLDTIAIGPSVLGAPLDSTGSLTYQGFLAKYAGSGWQWGVQGGGRGDDRFTSVALGPAGRVFVAGSFTDTAAFAPLGLATCRAGASSAFFSGFDQALPLRAFAPAFSATRLELTPNPVRQVVRLRGRLAGPVYVLDALGRVVRCQTVAAGAGEATLMLDGLPPGLYGVRCGRAGTRLVVE